MRLLALYLLLCTLSSFGQNTDELLRSVGKVMWGTVEDVNNQFPDIYLDGPDKSDGQYMVTKLENGTLWLEIDNKDTPFSNQENFMYVVFARFIPDNEIWFEENRSDMSSFPLYADQIFPGQGHRLAGFNKLKYDRWNNLVFHPKKSWTEWNSPIDAVEIVRTMSGEPEEKPKDVKATKPEDEEPSKVKLTKSSMNELMKFIGQTVSIIPSWDTRLDLDAVEEAYSQAYGSDNVIRSTTDHELNFNLSVKKQADAFYVLAPDQLQPMLYFDEYANIGFSWQGREEMKEIFSSIVENLIKKQEFEPFKENSFQSHKHGLQLNVYEEQLAFVFSK